MMRFSARLSTVLIGATAVVVVPLVSSAWADAEAEPAYTSVEGFDPAPPSVFQFGAGEAAHAATLASDCTSFERRELPIDDVPMATESHVQFDCAGFDYFGAPRLAEFVFVDDALTHVWVLTEADELPPLRTAFEVAFGAPSHDVPGMVTAFIPARAVLRHDVPEALYLSDAAAPFFASWFDGLSAEQE